MIYPDATGSGGAGESVTTTYDAGGRAYSLTANGAALVQTTLYTAGGAVYRQTLSNGRCTQNDYDVNQRLQRRRVGASCGQGSLLDLVYTYDLVGNVASIQNVISNTTATFAYDLRLQRLTGASGEYSATYAYDAVGNLTRKVEGSQALTLTYNAAQPAHGVKAVNGVALLYDATGNLTRTLASGVVYTQTWDRANRLAMVTSGGVTVTFGYDAAGALAVKTVATTTTVTTTHYLGGYYERTINGAVRRYYRLGDQLVLYDGTAYHYLYGDHLNSATLTTNASGTRTSETRYYPYGAHRYDWGSDPSDRDFTGQRRDAEIALLDYVARRYSPYLGRFISPDAIIPDPGNPQDLNRYSYTRNNPLLYRDPSGHLPEWIHFMGGAVTQYMNDMTFGVWTALVVPGGNMALNVSDAYQQGRELGRIVSTAQAQWEVANGVGMAAAGALAGPPTLAAAAACTAGTAGVCALPSGVVLTAEGAMVVAGAAEAAHGGAVLLYAKNHPAENMGDAQKHGRPSRNYDQKAQENAAIRSYERQTGQSLSKDQRKQLHQALHEAENPGYDDIVNLIHDLFGGK